MPKVPEYNFPAPRQPEKTVIICSRGKSKKLHRDPCELVGCKRPEFTTVEDMTDGEYLTVCRMHYTKMQDEGYPMREIE
jgi:hypothetical protein